MKITWSCFTDKQNGKHVLVGEANCYGHFLAYSKELYKSEVPENNGQWCIAIEYIENTIQGHRQKILRSILQSRPNDATQHVLDLIGDNKYAIISMLHAQMYVGAPHYFCDADNVVGEQEFKEAAFARYFANNSLLAQSWGKKPFILFSQEPYRSVIQRFSRDTFFELAAVDHGTSTINFVVSKHKMESLGMPIDSHKEQEGSYVINEYLGDLPMPVGILKDPLEQVQLTIDLTDTNPKYSLTSSDCSVINDCGEGFNVVTVCNLLNEYYAEAVETFVEPERVQEYKHAEVNALSRINVLPL